MMYADNRLKQIINKLRSGKTLINYSILKISAQGFLFLLTLVLAKALSPNGFGAYTLGMMIIYFFSAIFMRSSLNPSVVIGNAELKKFDKINRIFTIRIFLLIQALIIFYIIAMIFFQPLSSFSSLDKNEISFMFLAYTGFCIRYFIEGTLLSFNKRMAEALYDVTTNIISIIWLILIYCFFNINITTIFMMYFVSPVIAGFFLIRTINISKLIPLEFDKKMFIQIFNYTKWTFMGSIALFFVNWGDNFVLRMFVSLDKIGIYNLGYQIFKGVLILFTIPKLYYLPFISQNINDEIKMRNYLDSKRWIIMGAGITGVFILYISLPVLFGFFYSGTYDGSITVARILLIGSIFSLHQIFYSPVFDALRRYEFTQMSFIFMVGVNLTLDYILIYFYGYIGAAMATAITYAIMSGIYEIYFRSILPLNRKS